MTRRKGERTARMNERDYPHIVETAVPACQTQADYTAWSRRFDAMLAWHTAAGVTPVRGERRVADFEYLRWCFADPAKAEAFREAFDGQMASRARVAPGRSPGPS